MAFKFRYESLQRHRKTLRDIAQREFADAEADVNSQMAVIEGLFLQIDEAQERIFKARSAESVDIELMRSIEEFIGLQKIKIEIEREKVRELLSIMEEMQEALVLKARDYKVVEHLRTKELEKYKEKIRLIEAKEIDDINLMRHSRS